MDHVKEIVIVRHGETPYNVVPRVGRFLASAPALIKVGGLPDHLVPLSEKGAQQARDVGKRLAGLGNFDTYFDSGYRRSCETLDLILTAFPESERDPAKRRSHLDLREREPGYLFNMTVTEVNRYFPWYQEYEGVFGKLYATPPGGESIVHVCSRVHMFLISLRRARSGQKVLIVTHGRVMLCFRYWLEKIPASEVEKLFDNASIDNCDILRYVYDDSQHRHVRVTDEI
jgi:broad specificity phosphatase PhoE